MIFEEIGTSVFLRIELSFLRSFIVQATLLIRKNAEVNVNGQKDGIGDRTGAIIYLGEVLQIESTRF